MKGRAAAKRALACEAGAWATVPVMLMPIPHWLYSVLDWGSGAVTLGSSVTLVTVMMWNLFGPREPEAVPPAPEPRRPRACECRREQEGTTIGVLADGGFVTVPADSTAGWLALRRAAQAGTLSVNGLRYLGPPPVTTGPQVTAYTRQAFTCGSCGTGTAWCYLDHGRWSTPQHVHECGECVQERTQR